MLSSRTIWNLVAIGALIGLVLIPADKQFARQTSALAAGTSAWEQLGPGGGGQVQYLYAVPEVDGRLYWLSDMEGLFRSDNNGASWNYAGEGLTQGATYVVVSEPGNPNRLYLGTKAGIEISNDGGQSWSRATGSGAPPYGEFISTIAIHPTNPNIVFAAPGWHEDDAMIAWTNQGLRLNGQRIIYRSSDRGVTWQQIRFTLADGYRQVFSLEFNKNNPQVMYLGADAGVFTSTDGGANWTKLPPPAGVAADRSRGAALTPDGQYLYATYAIELDTTKSSTESIEYARRMSVYVTKTSAIGWTRLDAGLADERLMSKNAGYWRPQISPLSTATQHRLIIGPLRVDNVGLRAGTFTVAGDGSVSGTWTRVYENEKDKTPRVALPERRGFNAAVQPVSTIYTWTPASWSQEKVWLGDQMSVFVGHPSQPNNWQIISSPHVKSYTDRNSTVGYTPAHKHTGSTSIYAYDTYAYENYVVQGVADLGLLESWDYGETWSQRFFNMEQYYGFYPTSPLFELNYQTQGAHAPDNNWSPGVNAPGNWWYFNNVDAFLTVPTSRGTVMLAGLGFFFGGGRHNMGLLMANRLDDRGSTGLLTPDNNWQYLAGSSWERIDWFYSLGNYIRDWPEMYTPRGGLPNARVQTMAYPASNPNRVVVGTHRGLYMINDIAALVYDGVGQFTNIAPDLTNYSFRYVAFDPNNANVLYTMGAPYDADGGDGWGRSLGDGKVWKGTYNGTSWTWSVIFGHGGAGNTKDHDMTVWSHNGATYIAVSMPGIDGNEKAVYLSANGGANWTTILGLEQALRTGTDGNSVPVKSWYNESIHDMRFSALVGYQDQVYVALADHGREKAYGLFQGVRRSDGSYGWRDWSGTYTYGTSNYMFFADGIRMRVLPTNGTTYVYLATGGAAVWRRAVETWTPPAPTPTNTPPPTPVRGSVVREYWLDVSGRSVSTIPTGSPPSDTQLLTSLEGPTNWNDNYGSRIRGYLTAPTSGSYTFWIASDDHSQLWLSSNDQPVNKQLIASVDDWTNSREWTKYSSQKSAAITLAANQRYYFELLQKEGTGGDNLAVGWAKPGQPTTGPSEVIPGSVLSQYGSAPAPTTRVQYKESDANATNGSIRPYLRIVNNGTTAIPLSELKLRYWYTKDGTQSQVLDCFWSTVGCVNISGVANSVSRPNADTYMEVSFGSGAGSLAAGATIQLELQIRKADWSNYAETNDYSYDSTKTTYTDWNRITLYRNGVRTWGIEP